MLHHCLFFVKTILQGLPLEIGVAAGTLTFVEHRVQRLPQVIQFKPFIFFHLGLRALVIMLNLIGNGITLPA